ncbi:MAG: M20 family peptidase [Bacteroidota bacterium]
MKKTFLILLMLLTVLVVFVLIRTFTFSSKQLQVAPLESVDVSDASIVRFSKAIQISTVSRENPLELDSAAFSRFSVLLKDAFPLVDSLLEHQVYNQYSHVYKWQGSNPKLSPALLMGHLDVVPVAKEEVSEWKYLPFSGKVVDGQIWGRGTIDDKVSVMGLMEAAEMLLAEGYQPERTIYFAFGHDEENSGNYGAQVIAAAFERQGIRFAFALDEGYSIIEDLIPGMTQPVALIGLAEKGYTTLRLSTVIKGGHSSMPERETAIDLLSQAINNVRAYQFPARLSGPMAAFAEYLGPEMPFVNRMAFANKGLFKPLIVSSYEKKASGNALLRTTVAPTILSAGEKQNVIPRKAEAIINFRIVPGETRQSVLDQVRSLVNDDRIVVEEVSHGTDPSSVSSVEGDGFQIINQTIREIFPGTLVAPNLVIAATDSRFYSKVTENTYRFAPFRLNPDNISTFHGINERIGVEEYKDAIRFYRQLIRNSGISQNG